MPKKFIKLIRCLLDDKQYIGKNEINRDIKIKFEFVFKIILTDFINITI